MRVLITGGAGFIGSNLAHTLQERRENWDVIVLDNFSTGHKSNLAGFSGEVIECDVRDSSLLIQVMPGVDVVVHLAALGSVPRSIEYPYQTFSNNVIGTENLLGIARSNGCKKFIFASSSSVYGANPRQPKIEDDYLAPLSPYAASKVAGEALVQSYSSAYGFDFTILRFFNVYGPRQSSTGPYAAVVPKFIDACVAGREMEIFGDGEQSRDFTYIDTVTETIISCIDGNSARGQIVNVATGRPRTVNELAATVASLFNGTPKVSFSPGREGEVRHSNSDPTKFNCLFPDVVRTEIVNGLSDTVKWNLNIQRNRVSD